MKKKILTLISVIALVFGLSALFIACNETDVAYSVTVLSPGEEPISDVTVSWMSGSKEKGKAQTNEDGVATATLPAGNYTIALSGSKVNAYDYDEVTVNSSARDIEIVLTVKKVDYSVTVKDKNNNAATGVTVTWTGKNGTSGTGSATTDASGKASCKLSYGDYTVTLGNLPEGNFYDGGKDVSGANPSLTFNLRAANAEVKDYRVSVRSEGELVFKKFLVMVYSGQNAIAGGETDDNGVFSFSAEAGVYSVRAQNIPTGYKSEDLTLTADALEGELILKSAIITDKPADNTQYVIGDIFHDYTFETKYELTQYEYEKDENGEVVRDEKGNAVTKGEISSGIWSKSVAQILKEKQVLLINNWGTNCSWCVKEMPDMQLIYEKYSDVIEIVGVDNYVPIDTDATIKKFAEDNGLTFPLMRDLNGFTAKFDITGWPTTIVIDRYGAIARIEAGAITSYDAWERLINKYIGEDYKQTFTPGDHVSDSINTEVSRPDITVDDDHYEKLGEAINNTEQFPENASVVWSTGETQYEYAWPFLIKQPADITADDVASDIPYMYTSNAGKPNSMAVICAKVNVQAGKVFTFEYYIDTEKDYDSFFIFWDGRILGEISGKTSGWTTCHMFVELTDGEHDLILTYRKDGSGNEGKDSVYIRNVHFSEVNEITESNDMLRSAAYGDVQNGRFTHYAEAKLDENDVNGIGSKYYHVNIDSLANKTYAGNDRSPLLFANLTGVTSFTKPYTISDFVYAINPEATEGESEYLYSLTFTINGVTKDYRNDFIRYLSAAKSSYVANCVPVDEFLHDLLVAFMQEVIRVHNATATAENRIEWHENKWLEVCYFYSHYGEGDPIGNPILGVMEETAIEIGEGTHTADITRNMYPFPITIYTFTPEKDSVYKIESLLDASSQDASQIWLYRDTETEVDPLVYNGDNRVHRDGKNEQNFVVYYYMTAGTKYYLALAFIQSQGKYDFKITDMNVQSYEELVPASADTYEMVFDPNGNWSGEVKLGNAVEYEKKDDGYYYAKNGNPIYIDVQNAFTSLTRLSIEQLLDTKTQYPLPGETPEEYVPYDMFDFRYCVVYWQEGTDTIKFETNYDIQSLGAQYKDYTAIFKGIIADAKATQGDNYDGLIPVNQEIVDILTLFFELRVNNVNKITQNAEEKIVFDKALFNEWLRFCWYSKIHSAEYESLPATSSNGENN